ncbi:MAG: transposase [Gammaproteobacteria bacterium]|nr:transposase [Gammaproteobacteria bacterium]
MEIEERLDWNVYKQIFADHWEGFKERNPRYSNEYYNEMVEKMLKCGDPQQMGYIEYLCMNCGQGSRIVSMSCKSFLCLRCGKVYVDEWVSQVSEMLHEGVIYRHIVLTVAEVLRKQFYGYDEELLGALCRCGVKCLDEFFSNVSRKKVKGGYIVVLQTHGRNGQYNPHLHIIATSGGLEEETGKWIHLGYLPYKMLHKKWQWYLLEMLREEVDTEDIERLVDYCYKKYSKGFVANVQKGDVPNRYESLSKYLAKYVVSPPISVRRIDKYDGEEVTYHYRSHKTKSIEQESVDVYTFIGRMVQHILPKGFKRVRYYGVQATKTFEKYKGVIREALSKIKEVVKDAIKIIPRKDYRKRYKDSTGTDPYICEHCEKEMSLWRIWHPKYGVVYDECEKIKRGNYETKEKEAINRKGAGRTVWSSSGGIQLSLYDMWGGASC